MRGAGKSHSRSYNQRSESRHASFLVGHPSSSFSLRYSSLCVQLQQKRNLLSALFSDPHVIPMIQCDGRREDVQSQNPMSHTHTVVRHFLPPGRLSSLLTDSLTHTSLCCTSFEPSCPFSSDPPLNPSATAPRHACSTDRTVEYCETKYRDEKERVRGREDSAPMFCMSC